MPDPGPSYPPQPTPSARREHQSSGSRSQRSKGNPAVESAVTRLLVSIKSLLESLTQWSERRITEYEVSDVYVRLGNDFNAAVSAFAAFNIDMSELISVPDDLRGVLEECLAEEANSTNLNKFLPTVRGIITNLLQGLRTKQSLYRRVISDGKQKSTGSTSSGHERTDSRSSHASDRQTSSRQSQRTDSEARKRATSSSRTSRRKDSVGGSALPPPPAQPDDQFIGGFNVALATNQSLDGSRPPPIRMSEPPVQAHYPTSIPPGTNSYPPARNQSPINGRLPSPPAPPSIPPLPVEQGVSLPPPPGQPAQQVPSSIKRYSLVDRPVSSPPANAPSGPAVIVEAPSNEDIIPRENTASPGPETPPLDSVAIPAIASSLAALKKSDTLLERRASKRFSTYNISKMTGGGGRAIPSIPGGGTSVANRKSMAVGAALTQGDLAVLTETDEGEDGEGERPSPVRTRSHAASPFQPPPVPPLPPSTRDTRTPSPHQALTNGHVEDHPVLQTNSVHTEPSRSSGPFSVFLQVGREVKKVTVEPGLSFSSLRMLFLDRFSYNPGQENFPAIYLRDPSSGVQYELEDMEEVKEKCLLSLNIEPLDQIKQHIDTQMASLAQEIKDLKTTMASNRRNSMPPPLLGSQSFVESTPAPPRPTDKQLAQVVRRLSHFVHPGETPRAPLFPQTTGQSLVPQMTGASVMSEYTSRVVSDLRTQFDEVQNLRRDLGVMKQMYTEFIGSTKESLGNLRSQTQAVRQLAVAKVGGARAYIDAGKTSLDTRSQDVLTKMEELQDVVEGIKDDVLKRHVTPKPSVLSSIKADVDAVQAELDSLTQHISTVKPMWKKTWEEELQNIVEEQQFLHHQEEFLADLLEDQKAVLEVYGHVEKVISIRTSSSGRGKSRPAFRPPPSDDGAGGIDNVMMEIRNAAVDPERRMKAIAANQRNREKELASRSDEFEQELSGFVSGKKLKMTGGAEEVERLRQKRNDQTLKAMFTGGSISGGTTPSGTGSSGSRPGTPSGTSMQGTDANDIS